MISELKKEKVIRFSVKDNAILFRGTKTSQI